MANEATIAIARDVRRTLAGSALTEPQAKLYSQRLRRDMSREGLASFSPGDVGVYLDDAMLLLQCAFIEREADPTSGWQQAVKRAAEILEWLSQSSLKPPGAPLHLLSAAAYQLSGFPAMALGHLRRVPDDQPFSAVLRELLRANFVATLGGINNFWREQYALEDTGRIDPSDLTVQAFRHSVMCIGTVCDYLRTGNGETIYRALNKLEHLAVGFIYSRDPFSYILAKLTANTCRRFVETCLWPHVNRLRDVSSVAAGAALIQFARSAFVNNRVLVWPAQAVGIDRLHTNTSFVLCTPTGSGKTTVATLGVVQGLFTEQDADAWGLEELVPGNLVLYLVPSRALAAEVEGRLAQDLKGIAATPIVVTGLYGGVDWGPTDAWIQTDHATIVICTFEKADALIRYLGVLFLNRVQLVIVDEAHMVEQDQSRLAGLRDGTSRAFRLEQLGARLLRAREDYGFRIIALSAVASDAAPALARWVSGTRNALPTTSSYRSTRQMLGHLEVNQGGRYTIRYDLMDGSSLKFDDERRQDSPYVRSPFPPIPGGIDANDGPEVRMRKPTLWAALHLAAQRPDGSTPSVLISITQNIDAFSLTCADFIEALPNDTLPNFRAVNEDDEVWRRCLASAEDYFTVNSVEYRLLRRGIAVHHGKMPGILSRRLKILIDLGYVRVIIATSTLSEGVNIPVNFLLIPSVYRGQNCLSLQEFNNLIGRVGRPGVASEGSALVVLPERTMTRNRYGQQVKTYDRQWNGYQGLIGRIEETTTATREFTPVDNASSPLSCLLQGLEAAWVELTGGGTHLQFVTWLEQTEIVNAPEDIPAAYSYLDSLDAFLIASIQEVEELRHAELMPDQLEEELTRIWQTTYAFAAGQEEDRLGAIWLSRGRTIKELYPDAVQRRRIYKTSLAPRSASNLLELEEAVRAKLQEGGDYASWETEKRFVFVRDILALLSQVHSFRISTTLGRRRNFQDWPKLLRWWLAKNTLRAQPLAHEITSWFDFVAHNFIYRGTWGIGSILGLLLDGADEGQPIRPLEIGDWPRTGLPWIAFWMKELITWGTLEPVAAFLLARGNAVSRQEAETVSLAYYERFPAGTSSNDILDPRQVRNWVEALRVPVEQPLIAPSFEIEAILTQPPSAYLRTHLIVTPMNIDNSLTWIEAAGYKVATSIKPPNWPDTSSTFEFTLDVANAIIIGSSYRQHA